MLAVSEEPDGYALAFIEWTFPNTFSLPTPPIPETWPPGSLEPESCQGCQVTGIPRITWQCGKPRQINEINPHRAKAATGQVVCLATFFLARRPAATTRVLQPCRIREAVITGNEGP